MKKVLSFVLVLSLVLGSFSMAFAADTTATAKAVGLSDIKGITNEEAIKVAYDLGIVTGNPDGTFLPTKEVTRAEFAAMITRALAIPDSALAGYKATSFKDTNGYAWAVPYLAFCQSKGIMLGDGNGNVMPGRTISNNEAITMALRAAGYTSNSAQLVGVWPANYVTLAQNQKLYDKVASITTVDKANAAQVIYNLLSVQKVAVNTDGKTELLTVASNGVNVPATLFNTGLGCTVASTASVINGTENSLINLAPYIGDYAIKVTKDSNSKIIAIKEVKSKAIQGYFITKDVPSNTAITLAGMFRDFNKTEYTGINNASAGTVKYFRNGQEVSKYDMTSDSSVTINVKLDGKTITEIYSVEKTSPDASAKISDAQIKALTSDNVLLGKDFKKNDDKTIDTKSFELVGAKSLSDIKKDDIVYVYTNTASGSEKIYKVLVGNQIVTGKVTSYVIGTYPVDNHWVVNGNDLWESGVGNQSYSDLKVKNEVKLWLDGNGDIYKVEKVSGAADTMGVVQGYAPVGVNDEQVKLYTSADSSKTFNIDSKATITTAAGLSAAGDRLTSSSIGYVIGYSLNKDGKIDAINMRTLTSSVNTTLSGVKVLQTQNGSYTINNNVVVFSYNSSANEYKLSAIGKVNTNRNLGQIKLTLNADGEIVGMVVTSDNATKAANEVYGVITSDNQAYNAKLDKVVNQFVGFAGTTALDKLGSGSYVDMTNSNGMTSPVLYKVETDSDGFVKLTQPSATTAADQGSILKVNGNSVQIAANKWAQLATDCVVFQMKARDNDPNTFDKYTLSSVDSLLTGYTIYLYETNSETGHDGYDYAIIKKN